MSDYSSFSDVVPGSERELSLTAMPYGSIQFFSKDSMPVTVKPGEKVSFEVEAEIFEVSPGIRALPLSQRTCVAETDEEWNLKLFSTYS